MDDRYPRKWIIIGAASVFGLFTLFSSYYSIAPNEVGVVTRMGEIINEKQLPGPHLKLPFFDTVHYFDTTTRELKTHKDLPANTYTVDNQEVDVHFSVFFRIPADKAAWILTNMPDYEQRLLVMATDRTKSAMGHINIQQLAEKRGEIRDRIKNVMAGEAAYLGIEITGFNLTELTYDRGYRVAVAAAAVQKANIEAMEYQRQQAEKEAQKAATVAGGMANAAREKAKGEADANLVTATAEAKAIELKGLAQATSIKAQSEALQKSPELVEYTKANKWSGNLPQTMLGGVPIPFMSIGK